MKILITHFFSQKNKGDAAILSAMALELRRVFIDPEITVSTTEPIDPEAPAFEGLPLINTFFYHAVYAHAGTFKKILATVYVILTTTAWSLCKRILNLKPDFIITKDLQRILSAYENTDLIALVGGGYLTGKNSLQGNMTVLLHVHAIIIGLFLRKPTYLFSQSVGPFGNSFQGFIAAKALNRVKLICAREEFTVATLKKIKVKDALVKRAVDAAFLFNPGTKDAMTVYLSKQGVDFDKTAVGITVKRFLTKSKQDFYESEMARFIDWLVENNKQPVVIPQVTSKLHNDDDRDVGFRIGKLLKHGKDCVIIGDDLDHNQVKGIYENMNLFVGTRMHSCIFSLTAGVPIIAIEYEYKTGGIMKDLDLYDWVIKMEDVTVGRLSNKFTQLVNEKDKYRIKLKENISVYLNRARQTAEAIHYSYSLLNNNK